MPLTIEPASSVQRRPPLVSVPPEILVPIVQLLSTGRQNHRDDIFRSGTHWSTTRAREDCARSQANLLRFALVGKAWVGPAIQELYSRPVLAVPKRVVQFIHTLEGRVMKDRVASLKEHIREISVLMQRNASISPITHPRLAVILRSCPNLKSACVAVDDLNSLVSYHSVLSRSKFVEFSMCSSKWTRGPNLNWSHQHLRTLTIMGSALCFIRPPPTPLRFPRLTTLAILSDQVRDEHPLFSLHLRHADFPHLVSLTITDPKCALCFDDGLLRTIQRLSITSMRFRYWTDPEGESFVQTDLRHFPSLTQLDLQIISRIVLDLDLIPQNVVTLSGRAFPTYTQLADPTPFSISIRDLREALVAEPGPLVTTSGPLSTFISDCALKCVRVVVEAPSRRVIFLLVDPPGRS
ncbi:hypothetical protein NLI96_g5124 [Meripilus lineatus]|uniref:Uncharacterized protein n=1 Tax=Meripilus lineatus TaxID=2056292 RepID=A0AAD5V3L1_9APHY|nr:hypothetical protein NLI96_g5124 [Physisporinus lineatus]